MTSSDNADIVEAFIETNAREGLGAAIRRYAADNFIWWTPATEEIQDRIMDLAHIMHANYDDRGIRFTIRRVVCDGDVVVAEYEGVGRLRNGSVYSNRFLTLFVMSGGKIHEVREYHDSAHANAIWKEIFEQAISDGSTENPTAGAGTP